MYLFCRSLLCLSFLFSSQVFAEETGREPSSLDVPRAPVLPVSSLDSAEVAATAKPAATGTWFERQFATSASLAITSNYIFRGVTQTRNRAAIQGSLDITHTSGLGVGTFASNIDYGDADPNKMEADIYGVYNFAIKQMQFGVMAAWYNYAQSPHYNYAEYSAYAKYKWFKLDIAYAPIYWGTESRSYYARLTGTLPATEKDALVASMGRTYFSDSKSVGNDDYMDYKISLVHTVAEFSSEFAWTNTDRKDLKGTVLGDQAFTVTLSRTF